MDRLSGSSNLDPVPSETALPTREEPLLQHTKLLGLQGSDPEFASLRQRNLELEKLLDNSKQRNLEFEKLLSISQQRNLELEKLLSISQQRNLELEQLLSNVRKGNQEPELPSSLFLETLQQTQHVHTSGTFEEGYRRHVCGTLAQDSRETQGILPDLKAKCEILQVQLEEAVSRVVCKDSKIAHLENLLDRSAARLRELHIENQLD